MKTWLQIDTRYACGAIVIEDGVVVDCAPIFRKWAIGLTEEQITQRVAWLEVGVTD